MSMSNKPVKKISILNFEIGSWYCVDVVHIIDPGNFFVLPVSYRDHMPWLQKFKNNCTVQLELGKMVIFNSRTLHMYARGQVLSFNNHGAELKDCHVYACDYGIYENVPLSEMHEPYYDMNIPPLAVNCKLADCKPINGSKFDENSIKAMKHFVGNEQARMLIRGKESNKFIVELVNSCPDDITIMMAYTGYCLLGWKSSGVNKLNAVVASEILTFKYIEVKEGDVFRVRVQSGKKLDDFYVAQVDEFEYYLKKKDDYTNCAKGLNSLVASDLIKDLPVFVCDNKPFEYERSKILEIIEPDRVVVQLMDWGTTKNVNINRLKKIPQFHLENPAMAIHCMADNSQVWDNGRHNFLYTGFEFMVKIRNVSDSFLKPHVVDIIRLTSISNKYKQ